MLVVRELNNVICQVSELEVWDAIAAEVLQ
jgi:hypothetical protein